MEPVKQHRQLVHGLFISVRDLEGKEIFGGQVVGFPYNDSARRKSSSTPRDASPDTVLVRLHRSKKEGAKSLRGMGIGRDANPQRQTFIMEP